MSSMLVGPAEMLLQKKDSDKYFLAVSTLIPKITKELSEKWDGINAVEVSFDEEPANLVKDFIDEKLGEKGWSARFVGQKLSILPISFELQSILDSMPNPHA